MALHIKLENGFIEFVGDALKSMHANPHYTKSIKIENQHISINEKIKPNEKIGLVENYLVYTTQTLAT